MKAEAIITPIVSNLSPGIRQMYNPVVELDITLNILEAKSLISELQKHIDIFEKDFARIEKKYKNDHFEEPNYNTHASNTTFLIRRVIRDFKTLQNKPDYDGMVF